MVPADGGAAWVTVSDAGGEAMATVVAVVVVADGQLERKLLAVEVTVARNRLRHRFRGGAERGIFYVACRPRPSASWCRRVAEPGGLASVRAYLQQYDVCLR